MAEPAAYYYERCYLGAGVSQRVKPSLAIAERLEAHHRARGLTRDTRATVDDVMDPRTVATIKKLMKQGHISELFGTISTGKEANVYYSETRVPWVLRLAVKVFKTSILIFKDRAKYIEGEYRFRRGYCGGNNPRKMVRQWAEKEFRNLKRMHACCFRSPIPMSIRSHVFVMSFLGNTDGVAAPKVKTIWRLLSPTSRCRLYIETIVSMRVMFQKCKLVHGDLSEFNMLYHEGHVYFIDVSQAIEFDHLHALSFLKRDAANVTRLFEEMVCSGSSSFVEMEDEELLDERGSSVSDEDGCDEELETKMCSGVSERDTEHTNALNEVLKQSLSKLTDCMSVRQLVEYIISADPFSEFSMSLMCPSEQQDKLLQQLESHQLDVPWPMFDEQYRIQSMSECTSDICAPTGGLSKEALVDQWFAPVRGLASEEVTLANQEFNQLCLSTLALVLTLLDIRLTHQRNSNTAPEQRKLEDKVFIQSWQPTSLQEVYDTRILESESKHHQQQPAAAHVSLLERFLSTHNNTKPTTTDSSSSSSDSSSSADSEDLADKSSDVFDGHIPEGVDPKEWKRQVKAARRLARQSKKPKKQKRKEHKRATKRR